MSDETTPGPSRAKAVAARVGRFAQAIPARIGSFGADHLVDAAAIVGASLVTRGIDLIFHPLGFIVAGGFLLAGAWLTARQG